MPSEVVECPSRDAVILAAGRGGRFDESGAPSKCLVPVAGRPLIEWIASALASVGVRRAHTVLGHRAEEVAAALLELQLPLELRLTACPGWEAGNGVSAAAAEASLDGARRFWLVMGDHLVFPPLLEQVRDAAHGAQESCLLATSPKDRPDVDLADATKVRTDGAGRVLEIGKQLEVFDALDTGVFLMTPELFRALEAARRQHDASLTGGNRVLASAGRLQAVPVGRCDWQDVDTPADYLVAERLARGPVFRP
jgi:choline kinase